MKEVNDKFSTTQVAGAIAIAFTIYNTLAPAFEWAPILNLGAEQLNAFATVIVMILPTVYMMWRRTKKSALKLGLFK